MNKEQVNGAQHQLVDTKRMMQILRVSHPTFIKYRKKYNLPYVRIGAQHRYNPSRVIEALEKHTK